MLNPDDFISHTHKTLWARIYMSGPIEVAKQAMREHCLKNPVCFTITATTFLYPGGEETGFIVEHVNYPRHPVSEQKAITTKARALMERLLEATHQHTALLMTPDETEWVSRRPEHKYVAPLPPYPEA